MRRPKRAGPYNRPVKEIQVAWQSDAERFVATGAEGMQIVVNAPHRDEASPRTGIGPAELLLVAAGTCSAWDVVEILRKQRQAVDAVEVRVIGEQDPEPPWAFVRIGLEFTIRGRGIRRELAERAVQLSEERYCSVTTTIRRGATVTSSLAVEDAVTPLSRPLSAPDPDAV